MTFQSILFERTQNSVPEVGLVAPVFFADLNLDQTVNTITNGKDEYNLKPFFYESLNDAITYRHEIMRDLEDHKLFKYVKIFARKMSTIRDHMAQTDKLYHKWQKDAWLFDTIEIYCEAINSFANDLSTASPTKSRGFLAFRKYLINYSESSQFTSLIAQTKRLKADLSEVKYCLLIKGNSITIRKYDTEIDYSSEAFLMHKDRDFDLQSQLPSNEQALTKDMELNTLLNAMARGDEFVFEVARSAILSGLNNTIGTILYRQDILKDCLKTPSVVRDIYEIAIGAIEEERKNFWGVFSKHPALVLHRSRDVLEMFSTMLKRLKNVADEHADRFESEGFKVFFVMLQKELDDEYFASVQARLKELKFHDGVLIRAELGKGNKGSNYVLRKSHDKKQSWMERIFTQKPPVYTFYLHPRDESGARALSELNDKGFDLVATALAQSVDHILSFFKMLRTELAFYIGCLNLHWQLAQKGEPMSFPLPVAPSERRHSFKGLYDVCLTLSVAQRVVGNDVNADDKDLVIITGANQGGKSTLLRSIGLAQLMMQCGMFAPAESFSSNVCDGLFTHYKREEDVTMKSGKLDEELSRMSEIADKITSSSMLLFNESFAATNEREGSEIARQIINALLEERMKIFFVTHLYEFAHGFFDKKMGVERDGRRPPRRRWSGFRSRGERVFRAVIGVQDLGEHRLPPRLFGPPNKLRKPCHGCLLPTSHIFHFRLGQQMAWQIEGVGDHRRDHGAPNHGRYQALGRLAFPPRLGRRGRALSRPTFHG